MSAIYNIAELQDKFLNLAKHHGTVEDLTYIHKEPAGYLGLGSNEIATKLAQLFMVVGVGKSLRPMIDYDPNTIVLKFNKSSQFSNGIGLMYDRQFANSVHTLREHKYATFEFTQRGHTDGQKDYFNKCRIAHVDMQLRPNEIMFRIIFRNCLLFPGLLYDLAMMDVLIEQVKQKIQKIPAYANITTTACFHFMHIQGNGSPEMLCPVGNYSGFKQFPNSGEANQMLDMEEAIRGHNLTNMPSALMPLNQECEDLMKLILNNRKAYAAKLRGINTGD